MNDVQEAKVSMYLKVQTFLNDNIVVLTALFSIITTLKGTLDAFLLAIFEADAIATADNTGAAEAKANKRLQLKTLLMRISGAGTAYYKLQGDDHKQEEMFMTETEFNRAHDSAAYTKAMQIFKLADALGAALAPHGITLTDISNLNLYAQQYLALLSLPKNLISQQAAQGKKVDNLLKETDDFLKETLDPQMRVLKGTENNDLFDEYEGNRGIDDNPSGGSGITVIVEGSYAVSETVTADLTGVNANSESTVTIETFDSPAGYFASETTAGLPTGTRYDRNEGTTITMPVDEFKTLIGWSPTKQVVRVQNIGMVPGSFKLTFNNLSEE
jgi:hypothetical protein